ncbi:DNA-directed RNA polymerase III subunit RPC8-like [Daphnia pulex]|uniref:EOG090X0DHL n=1 Tax=Daphnia pulex TaxID=6669 RepID=A0A4Y7MRZ2_DAPPU|nr:DNA-directed RNA polymerase III subunit RPC8-like [Daphnia pulex]SVE84507.1 EOG090X0DHL [Daphnia pulex]
MFVLALVKQTVRVPSEKFNRDIDQAISEELNLKFANKVVLDVGLCIALWDIIKRGESFILPGDGGHHTKVEFRYVVFRPFMEQILVGRIKNCDKESVQVSLGFFEDIFISSENLQKNSRFDETEHLWIWEYQTEDGKHDLFMDTGEEIRFKVVAEYFIDTTPSGPSNEAPDSSLDPIKDNKRLSYRINASINESGLGLLSWWAS